MFSFQNWNFYLQVKCIITKTHTDFKVSIPMIWLEKLLSQRKYVVVRKCWWSDVLHNCWRPGFSACVRIFIYALWMTQNILEIKLWNWQSFFSSLFYTIISTQIRQYILFYQISTERTRHKILVTGNVTGAAVGACHDTIAWKSPFT